MCEAHGIMKYQLKYMEEIMEEKIILFANKEQVRIQLKEFENLNKILADVGVKIEIEELSEKYPNLESVVIKYDIFEYEKIKARGAGRPRKRIEKNITVEEIRKRMQNETAEHIAEELGIGRQTLFRKLKEAEQFDSKYLY